MSVTRFTCSRCGESHHLPMSIAFEAPVYWHGIPEGERAHRAVLDEEICVIDDQHFFISRGATHRSLARPRPRDD